MDFYAGSEPRLFISFCSDNEPNGQPTQQTGEEEMDTTPISVVAPEQGVSPKIHSFPELEKDQSVLVQSSSLPPVNVTPVYVTANKQDEASLAAALLFNSSGSEESCSAFIARKLDMMQDLKVTVESPEKSPKVSISDKIPTFETTTEDESPVMDATQESHCIEAELVPSTSAPILVDPRTLPRQKKVPTEVNIATTGPHGPDLQLGTFSKFLRPTSHTPSSDGEQFESTSLIGYTSSEAPNAVDSDQESSVHPRSTFAQTMAHTVRRDTSDQSDDSSEITVIDQPREPTGLAALSIGSREIIRKYFSETRPISLPQGHPTFALKCVRLLKNLMNIHTAVNEGVIPLHLVLEVPQSLWESRGQTNVVGVCCQIPNCLVLLKICELPVVNFNCN